MSEAAWYLASTSDTCRFSSQRSPIRCRVSSDVEAGICELVTGRSTETGGLLIGTVVANLAEVVMFSTAGPKALELENNYRPDPEFDLRMADTCREHSDRLRVIGSWHSHTMPSDRHPSGRDLVEFAKAWHAFGAEVWMELIAVPEPTWSLERFCVRESDYGHPVVCERSAL